jgi:hypothetical protein
MEHGLHAAPLNQCHSACGDAFLIFGVACHVL